MAERNYSDEIRDLRKEHNELNQTVFDLVTEVAVIKRTLYGDGNGSRGLARMLESINDTQNTMQISIRSLQTTLDTEESKFQKNLKVLGIWIAGLGLTANVILSVVRLSLMG